MDITKIEHSIDFLKESYNRNNGITLGYIAYTLFLSEREEMIDKISHIFDVAGIIDIEELKNARIEITRSYLLDVIFDCIPDKRIVKRSDLRKIVGLKNRTTFNKYFSQHINAIIPKEYNGSTYTLYETFQILNVYQGGDIWGRMKIYSKGELAKKYFNRNYEMLEVTINKASILAEYINADFIFPAEIREFIQTDQENNLKQFDFTLEKFHELEISIDCLEVFFYLFVLHKVIVKDGWNF